MIPTTDLASQLEQIARRLHSQGYASKLFPAQWAALRYIHSAPVPLRMSSVVLVSALNWIRPMDDRSERT